MRKNKEGLFETKTIKPTVGIILFLLSGLLIFSDSDRWQEAQGKKSSKIIYLVGSRSHRDIFIMNEDGTEKKQLTKTSFSIDWPTWSPDGEHIIFVSYDKEHRGLYLADRWGKNIRKIPTEAKNVDVPCWSSDGKLIAFMVGDARGIRVCNLQGRILKTLAGEGINGAYQQWSLAEPKLIFESNRDGNPEIYSLNTDTGKSLKRLTNNKQLDEWPSFSKDGTKIAWTRGIEGNKNIWLMDRDGKNKRQVTKNIPIGDAFHSFSPDSSRLAFTSGYEGKSTYIYIINLDGSGLKKIVEGATASWSPYSE